MALVPPGPHATDPSTRILKNLSKACKDLSKACTVVNFSSDAPGKKDKSLLYVTRMESEYKLGKHRSDALSRIMDQPVIEVETDVAVCDGGGGALGHPLEYIAVGNLQGGYAACIYCGLRYRKKA